MARIFYTSVVDEIRGSVLGSTFQRNSSGTTVKGKNNQRFSPSSEQSEKAATFGKIATLWAQVSAFDRDTWNGLAVDYPRTSWFGNTKQLNGYQYFMMSNLNLLAIGEAPQSTPAIYEAPTVVPNYTINVDAATFELAWSPDFVLTGATLVVFVSPPTLKLSSFNRTQRFFLKTTATTPLSSISLKAEYEALFGITWASFFASAVCQILIFPFTVRTATGLPSQYTLSQAFINT